MPVGNCNGVGVLGAILGGGMTHLQGFHGFGIDNLVTLNLVDAEGTLREVNEKSNPELWWAVRGAGPNFGIVTAATMKVYADEKRIAWTGDLIFDESKLEQVVSAIENLDLKAPMSIYLFFGTSGAPDYTPVILVQPFYIGPVSQAEKAFASILDIGPISNDAKEYPYKESHFAGDPFCVMGGRKPTHGVGLGKMVPETWRAAWDEYAAYVKNPGLGNAVLFVECYPFEGAERFSDSSAAYPFRSTIKYFALCINNYSDPSLDPKAQAFNGKIRSLLRSTSGLEQDST